MNPNELLRIVDAIHRDKNIDKEIVFEAIEAALVSAARKHYGEESVITINIGRDNGEIVGTCDGEPLDEDETVGRIGAQTAKQVIIQKIREAERDSLFHEYEEMIGQLSNGIVQRADGGMTTVSLGNIEAILPRSEQIPGESHHANERIRTTVADVRKQGSRVKVVLSRSRPQLVQRLFEQEIPEIADGVISVKAMSREAGYRSKVAVHSIDERIDCVGACVGVRGSRIKNIVDELAGERIDIVRWNEDMESLIPNSLQPAEVDEVILCKMMGRAIVLVSEDQLSLAIGRRGQNVRLASKLCGWDIEIMTREELEEQIERAIEGFTQIEGLTDEVAETLVGEGFLSFDDLEVIEPDALMAMGDYSTEQVDAIVLQAEEKAKEAEQAAVQQRRRQKEEERVAKATAEADAAEAAKIKALAKEQQEADGQAETPDEPTEPDDDSQGDTPDEAEPVATDDDADEPVATDDDADEPVATDDDADEPAATDDDADEPAATDNDAGEPAATDDATDEPTDGPTDETNIGSE